MAQRSTACHLPLWPVAHAQGPEQRLELGPPHSKVTGGCGQVEKEHLHKDTLRVTVKAVNAGVYT